MQKMKAVCQKVRRKKDILRHHYDSPQSPTNPSPFVLSFLLSVVCPPWKSQGLEYHEPELSRVFEGLDTFPEKSGALSSERSQSLVP